MMSQLISSCGTITTKFDVFSSHLSTPDRLNKQFAMEATKLGNYFIKYFINLKPVPSFPPDLSACHSSELPCREYEKWSIKYLMIW